MTNFHILVLLVCVVFASAQSCSARQFVLVKDGISKCAIVLPDDSTSSMEYGANDLSKHLKLISGADVRVYKQEHDKDIPSGYDGLIFITDKQVNGIAPITKEAFRIATISGKPWMIRIYGDNKRGAMYGCYGFLQDVLGCRWYTSTISKIPIMKTIAIGTLKIQQKPAFEYREPFYAEAMENREWLVRNRVNGLHANWINILDDSVGGKVTYDGGFVHTLFSLIPPSKYFSTHPEYFALVNGKRAQHTQLCLSNPDVLDICIAGVKQWIRNNPKADIFSVSQMDSPSGACECENCSKIKEEEGAESGSIIRFVNAVALEVGKEFPNAIIDTIAYNYSQTPPKHVKPLPNVRIRFCLTMSCKAHSLEAKCGELDFKDLYAWGKITNQLYVWDYNTDYRHFMLLNPSIEYTKTVFRVCKENGVVGTFTQGSYPSPGGSFAELKAYLCARLMWDPFQNADKVMNEYIEGVYGKSAPIIKKWIAMLISSFNRDTHVKLGNYDLPDAPYLTNAILDKSEAFIAEAYVASANEPTVLKELGKIRMWIDYTRISQINPAGDVKNGKYIYNITPVDLDKLDRWIDAVKHYQVTHFGEGVPADVSEVLTRESSQLDCLSLENDKLRVDVLPTAGGKIMRLFDKKNGVDLMLPPVSAFHRVEGAYESYVVEKMRGSEFWDTKFESSLVDKTIILKGISPAGREITKQYSLVANKIVLSTTVKNTTAQPLTVKFRERGMFPIQSFKDINISFATVLGENVELDAKDFTDNWIELEKQYLDNNKPSGKIVFKLKNTTVTNRFDTNMLEMLYICNDMYITRINLELFCKTINLQPNESTSFEQNWTIE